LRVRPIAWLRNTARNRLKQGLLGRLVAPSARDVTFERVRIVSATRMDEQTFWKSSALGQSLAIRRADPRLVFDIAFSNKTGLPKVYNAAIVQAGPRDALMFVHDDIWLDDPQWLDKLLVALKRYDVVGLAGNRRRVGGQPAWLYTKVEDGRYWLDGNNLSGAVCHGKTAKGKVSYFGPSPAHCELLDGLFIAARGDLLKHSRVAFDGRFDFHFYDLDFCRGARAAGLSIGTWPIMVTHQSTGAFDSPGWHKGRALYVGKWKA
jgi:protein O-GlcNAc transferase